MKKFLFFGLFLATIVIFEFCSSSKKAHKSTAAAATYTSSVQNIVATNCSPCHVGSGARQKRLDNYEALKNNIDEILRRIQLNPGDKGFMPMRHPKLPDSTIQVFVNWKNNGLMQ